MTLPTSYENIIRNTALAICRTLYKKIETVDTSDVLYGYELNLNSLGKWQIAFKIHKVQEDETIDITDEELEELEYEEVEE